MDAVIQKALEELIKKAVADATATYISWQMLSLIAGGVITTALGAFKIIWERYTKAMDMVKQQADTRGDKAEERVEQVKKEAKEKAEREEQIRKETRAECEKDRDEWKVRYLVEQTKIKNEVSALLGSVQETLTKIEVTVPAAINANSEALDDNDQHIEKSDQINEDVRGVLKAVQHNYKSLKPILERLSELVKKGG